jgi:hypothetical protein
MSRSLRYITDEAGNKTAVILPIEEYEEMLEDMHVIRAAYETRDEPRRPLSEVLEELRATGEIDVIPIAEEPKLIPWKQVKAELVSEGKLDADV